MLSYTLRLGEDRGVVPEDEIQRPGPHAVLSPPRRHCVQPSPDGQDVARLARRPRRKPFRADEVTSSTACSIPSSFLGIAFDKWRLMHGSFRPGQGPRKPSGGDCGTMPPTAEVTAHLVDSRKETKCGQERAGVVEREGVARPVAFREIHSPRRNQLQYLGTL